MTRNTRGAIIFGVFALGLILGLLGWVGDVYSSGTGTILFIVCILATIVLRILWRVR